MKTLTIICAALFLLPLSGCKQTQEQIEGDKWKHAKTLEAQIKINQDNNFSMRMLAKTGQKHAQIMKDKFNAWSELLIKFVSVMVSIAFLLWSALRYYWQWSTERLIQAFRMEEVKQEQITKRRKDKLALAYIFDPVIFEKLSKEERKLVFEGFGQDQKPMEKLESKTPIKPEKITLSDLVAEGLKKALPVEKHVAKAMKNYKSEAA